MKKVIITILFINILMAQDIKVVSAANLKFFFDDIIDAYNLKYPNDNIIIEFNSSGELTKKIINGKKYDIFLAANMYYPQRLYKLGFANSEAKLYTTGSLILLVSKQKGLSKDKLNILLDPTIKEITIANKRTAPYGMAAIEALKNANIYDKVKDKLFYSTDASNIIGDVLWYGHTGILPKSAINFLPRGYNIEGENYIDIPQEFYKPIKQGFCISKDGIKRNGVNRFINFILGEGQDIFKRNGYK